ncbi:MAG TPA: glycosyltransferase [Thermomicrobiales bacterium]|nr:glycosyltransferase [Thermomicrobiales bacterium]
MHIVYVIPYFAPAWGYGGPPRVMYDAARRLVRRGHAVTVLTTDALDGERRVAPRQAKLDGITVRYLPNLSNRLAWKAKIFLPLGFRRALEALLPSADVIHLSDFRSVQNAIGWRAAHAADVPYVISAYGQLPRGRGLKRPLKVVFDHRDGYAMVRHAEALLAQTAHEAACYRRLGGDPAQIRLVPLAVDLDEFAELPPRGAFRRRHGIEADEVVFLFVGRFHEYKGLDLLIRSFAAVARTCGRARLVLVGRDDGYLATLQRLIAALGLGERVLLPGPIYGPERLTAYVDADIFAFSPSYYEETSTAALEALACGTPVVITEQSGIPWLAEYGAGVEVPHDLVAFGAALARCLDEGARRDLAANARRLITERFSWERVVEALERTYAEARGTRVAQAPPHAAAG